MNSQFTKVKKTILDILFPPLCLGCGKYIDSKNGDSESLCRECGDSLKTNSVFYCSVCGSRLAEDKRICHLKDGYLLGAAGSYDNQIIKNLIYSFKYQGADLAGQILADFLVNYLRAVSENSGLNLKNFVITPVPLYFWREKKRGFNQAEILGHKLAEEFGLALEDILKRIKDNKPQAKIQKYELREENIRNCFTLKNPDSAKNKNIILVDDVFTSGATMNEAVRILKAGGARRTIGLVVAKA